MVISNILSILLIEIGEEQIVFFLPMLLDQNLFLNGNFDTSDWFPIATVGRYSAEILGVCKARRSEKSFLLLLPLESFYLSH